MIPTVILLFSLFISSQIVEGGFRPIYRIAKNVGPQQLDLQSPCPSVFQYQNDETGKLIGFIKIYPFDQQGKIQLDMELSVGNSVEGYNGKIYLAEDKRKVIDDIVNRRPIYYKVDFPRWNSIPPKVTKIAINGNMICSGPRIPLQMVPILTTINLQHKLRMDVTPLSSSSDPSVDFTQGFLNVPGFESTQGGNQVGIYDMRDSPTFPYIPNNDLTKRESTQNPVKNPFLFNPQAPADPNKIYSGNPFFTGLSTPQPPRTEDDNVPVTNPFFNSRTEIPTTFRPSTSTEASKVPQRGSDSTAISPYDGICGRPITTESLIFYGNSVPNGAYPWLTAIFINSGHNLSYICSGSLISDRHVVTAAHCVKTDQKRLKANELVCILGKLNLRKWGNGERVIEPDSIVVHPDYKSGTADADLAVMILSEAVVFTKIIRPICLWTESNDLNQIVGTEGTVLGWGRDENGLVTTDEAKQVKLPIVSQEQCLRSGIQFQYITSPRTFCAGFRNGSGPCSGDSGSAFHVYQNGRFLLRGIVSTAVSDPTTRTCDLRNYVVFTDASKFLDWLMAFVK